MTDETWPDGFEPPKAVIEAAAWASRFIDGASPSNLAALKSWFSESTENREALASVMFSTPISPEIRARIEQTLGQAFPSAHRSPASVIPIEAGRTSEPGIASRPSGTARSGSRTARRIGVAAAASVAVLALAVGVAPSLTGLSLFSTARAEIYQTGHGDIRSFALSDGSHMTLDTDSRVKVVMDRARRHAELEEGRARFVVKADERPFTIEAGTGKVVTTGGTLDAAVHRDQRVDLQLRSGVADLYDGDEGKGRAARMMTVNQPVAYEAGAFQPRPVPPPAADTRDWPDGWVDCRTIQLSDLVREANRYAKTPVIIDDQASGLRAVTGRVKLTDTDQFVKRIAELLDLKVSKRPDGTHLSRR